MNLDRTTATFACACRRCGNRWRQEYDVIEWTDTEGTPVRWFSDHGMSVPCPDQHGICCPRCGGLRVDAAPARPGDEVAMPVEDRLPAAGADREQEAAAEAAPPRRRYGPPFPAF